MIDPVRRSPHDQSQTVTTVQRHFGLSENYTHLLNDTYVHAWEWARASFRYGPENGASHLTEATPGVCVAEVSNSII